MDAVLCVAAFFVAHRLRSSEPMTVWIGPIGGPEDYSWMAAASLVLHLIIYPYFGFYESLRLKRIPDILSMALRASFAEFFILGSLVFFLQAKDTSRYLFGFYLFLNYSFVLLSKLGIRTVLMGLRRRGYHIRQVLIAGTGTSARNVVRMLERNRHWGYVPCGALREKDAADGARDVNGVPVIGTIEEAESAILGRAVDEVFFALDRIDAREIESQVALCERLGIPARFSLSLFDLPNSKVAFSSLGHVPVMTFYTTLMTPMEAFLKRMMDICVALVGLAITTAVYPWIAWRIRKESPGPVVFKQVRVGENGRRFKCYKFRTMYLDAEARKQELMRDNAMDGPIFKLDIDPRITPFGAFLRKTSLDELPQFLNILRGDMSLVGTRPPTPDEVSRYQTHYRRRLSVRPGLTGLWQVSGRSQIRKFEDVLALDLEYIDRWSIWLDVQIVFKTVLVVLSRRGAA